MLINIVTLFSNFVQMRQQFHNCGLPPNIERRECGSGGTYSQWSDWGPCSTTCFGGDQQRYRFHNCDKPVDTESRVCGQPPTHGEWGAWGSCSVSCGTGTRNRVKIGICGAEDVPDVRHCYLLSLREIDMSD